MLYICRKSYLTINVVTLIVMINKNGSELSCCFITSVVSEVTGVVCFLPLEHSGCKA